MGIYKIADTSLEIRSIHEQVQRMCRPYSFDGEPELMIETTENDIEYERKKSSEEDALEGRRAVNHTDAYLETLAVYRKLALALIDRDILLIHGSAIAVDNEAYLFIAKSGTGKSTHTRLWRQKFGDRAYMVNDDKPLIHVSADGAVVYGTPWDGKHRLSRNVCVPLKAVCVLERGEENCIEPLAPAEALPYLLQQCFRPKQAAQMVYTLSLLGTLGKSAALYRLHCNMEPEAADVAYALMSEARA